jgi:long-chain acyl-CoA synthetase
VELAPGVAADEDLQTALKAACAAQLAKYKIPEVWTFVDAMPRNAMNKIVKPRLKEMV